VRRLRNSERLSVLEERLRGMRAALRLQAREYERRLTDLNHAHDKQVQDQHNYVSDDRYTGWQGEINTFRDSVNQKLATLSGKDTGSHGTRDIVMWVLMFLIALGAVAATLYKH
jgi:hypothetical protein